MKMAMTTQKTASRMNMPISSGCRRWPGRCGWPLVPTKSGPPFPAFLASSRTWRAGDGEVTPQPGGGQEQVSERDYESK